MTAHAALVVSTPPAGAPDATATRSAVLAPRADAAPPASPLSLDATPADVDALWRECLDRPRHTQLQPRADWSPEARDLFDLVKPVLAARASSKPWLIGQLGQSLDGCIATAGGDSHYVNGARVHQHLHRLRALCDAVIVGAGTAVIDDPQLTTRLVEGPDPVRVVLDPDLRVPPDARLFVAGQAGGWIACDASRRAEAEARYGSEQVLAIEGLAPPGEPAALHRLVHALAARGLRVLFVEGGGVLVSRFMAQGLLDRLHLSIAPVVIGDGRRGLQLPQGSSMRECLRPTARSYSMAPDVMWDLDLRSAASP